jgi:hypothetical protein
MRYMLVIYRSDEDWTTRPTEEIEPVLEAHESFGAELRRADAFIAAETLQPSSTVTTIRLQSGQPLITDGSFVESKEQIGGFYLIEARNLDAAIEWGAKLARIEENPIAVWPVIET